LRGVGFNSWGCGGCKKVMEHGTNIKMMLVNFRRLLIMVSLVEKGQKRMKRLTLKLHVAKLKGSKLHTKSKRKPGCHKHCPRSCRSAETSIGTMEESCVFQHYWAPQCVLNQSQKGVGATLTRALRFAVLKSYLRCSVAINSCIRPTLAWSW